MIEDFDGVLSKLMHFVYLDKLLDGKNFTHKGKTFSTGNMYIDTNGHIVLIVEFARCNRDEDKNTHVVFKDFFSDKVCLLDVDNFFEKFSQFHFQ